MTNLCQVIIHYHICFTGWTVDWFRWHSRSSKHTFTYRRRWKFTYQQRSNYRWRKISVHRSKHDRHERKCRCQINCSRQVFLSTLMSMKSRFFIEKYDAYLYLIANFVNTRRMMKHFQFNSASLFFVDDWNFYRAYQTFYFNLFSRALCWSGCVGTVSNNRNFLNA